MICTLDHNAEDLVGSILAVLACWEAIGFPVSQHRSGPDWDIALLMCHCTSCHCQHVMPWVMFFSYDAFINIVSSYYDYVCCIFLS